MNRPTDSIDRSYPMPPAFLIGMRRFWRRNFDLRDGQADRATIDRNLRAGVALRGPTLWILMFAIFIASIGLDVNSTAVIIGAMLISPLMGPIMGIGYGAGIYDFRLIRTSLRNLLIATAISLGTSTIYFLCSPMAGEHSELLARTTPTIWDVLIALFGGLAGMVAATRSEKTNVLPGVAIATALMPPLCTAGYGIANGNWSYFGGAFYLFAINCVFIAFATMWVTWFITRRNRAEVDAKVERRVKRIVTVAVLLTACPSVYLAYRLVDDEVFQSRATQFISHELQLPSTLVAGVKVDPHERRMDVKLVGDTVGRPQLDEITAKLGDYGLAGTTLLVRQVGGEQIDVSALSGKIADDIYGRTRNELDSRDKAISALEQRLRAAEELRVLNEQNAQFEQARLAQVAHELQAQYPQIREVLYTRADRRNGNADVTQAPVIVFNALSKKPLPSSEKAKIGRWLKVRLQSDDVMFVAS
nr:DUF389 domain-containing protein [Burkholderia ambifaria]